MSTENGLSTSTELRHRMQRLWAVCRQHELETLNWKFILLWWASALYFMKRFFQESNLNWWNRGYKLMDYDNHTVEALVWFTIAWERVAHTHFANLLKLKITCYGHERKRKGTLQYLSSCKIPENICGKEIRPTVPTRCICSIKIVTVNRSKKGCIDGILKRLWRSMIQLNHASCRNQPFSLILRWQWLQRIAGRKDQNNRKIENTDPLSGWSYWKMVNTST